MSDVLAAAQTRALGTTARVVVLGASEDDARPVDGREFELVEQACSRFRADSDLAGSTTSAVNP